MKKTIVAILITGTLFGAAAAWAWMPGQGRGPAGDPSLHQRPLLRLLQGEKGRLMALYADLDVSPDQREQIQGIVRGYRDELAPLIQQLVRHRQAMRKAVIVESADLPDVQQTAEALGASITEVSLLAVDIGREVRAALTPEQIGQLETFSEEHDAAVVRWIEKHGARPLPEE